MSKLLQRRTNRRAANTLALAAAALIAGCASVPPSQVPQAPAVNVPEKWSSSTPAAQQAITDKWWRDFNDPTLTRLVESALAANSDLKIATARLAQARALTEGAEANRLPRLDGIASAERGRENAMSPRADRFSAGLRASWEIDLFGKGAQTVAAAQADSESAARDRHAARIAVAADVASAYYTLRTMEQRIALKREAIQLAERQTTVSARKFEAGQATALDRERWQAELAQEQAALVELDGNRKISQQQLALLLGDSRAPDLGPYEAVAPTAIAATAGATPRSASAKRASGTASSRSGSSSAIAAAAGTSRQGFSAALPPPPAALLPATLLERRPDVQSKARALDAALARAGVARKDIYPNLQIAWTGSRERLAVEGTSAASRFVLGYGVSVSVPLLDSGRIRANVAVHDARAQQAMAEYEKAMLTALVDVETRLTQWNVSGEALQQWQTAQTAAQTAAQNSSRLYDAGMADLTSVLQARQSHLRARDALAQATGARWEAAVGLRRAFAGGLEDK